MNWDAIGAIAETLGAAGVIASFVYLAGQIRQSRDQMRAATAQQFQAQVTSTAQEPVRNAELARLVRRGIENLDQLDDDERYRFYLYISPEGADVPRRGLFVSSLDIGGGANAA